MDLEPYWEAVRKVYAPFESGLPAPTGRVYDHEIPGGQLSNLRQQAIALGLGEKFEADRGHVRGGQPDPGPADQGDSVVQGGRRPGPAAGGGRAPTRRSSRPNPQNYDIPDSVIGFLSGELGDPPGGWPEPFRTKALAGRDGQAPRRGAVRGGLGRAGRDGPTRQATLNRLLFPGPTKEFAEDPGDVRGRRPAGHAGLPLRAAAGRRARRRGSARASA